MADWLPDDHLAWFVLEVIDQIDTAAFHEKRRLGRQGRQGYDPDMLLALLIYAYAVGERSSRRIEKLCVDHVAFRVLCAQDGPDHSTLARFRAVHESAFKDVFAQILRLCGEAGMVKVGVVAIDGTKIAANSSRSANRSSEWVREQAQRAAQEIVDEAEATDAAEDAESAVSGSGGEDLPTQFATRRGRRANIKKALEELERREAADTEADACDQENAEEFLARIEAGEAVVGPLRAGVDPVRYQRARVERQRQRIADLDGVSGKAASRQRRDARKALKQAEQALSQAEAEGQADMRGPAARARDKRAARARQRGATADSINVTDPDSRMMSAGSGGGSVQGYNAQVAVTDDHLILGIHLSQDANDTHCYRPTLAEANAHAESLGKNIALTLADAGYFTDENLTSPGPDRLIAPGKNHQVHTQSRERPAQGPPPKAASAKDQMRYRLRDPAAAERYKRRSATVETVIAHLKDQIGLRRFARRGLTAATAELHLAAAAVNLNRLHHAKAPQG